jgi:septal ring factor EnvC (AmiA/AmiB activator)
VAEVRQRQHQKQDERRELQHRLNDLDVRHNQLEQEYASTSRVRGSGGRCGARGAWKGGGCT